MNTFSHQIEGRPRPARRVTDSRLGSGYGPDRNRPLVVELRRGDLITLRPLGTRRAIAVQALDVYRWALQGYALSIGRRVQELRRQGHSKPSARRIAEREYQENLQ